MMHSEIKNIIFDLGGVILNIDPMLSVRQFGKLCGLPAKEILKKLLKEEFLYAYERGEISCREFREGVRRVLRLQAEDALLDEAWNKLLLDIPKERLTLLKHLRRQYNLFLLSNTNKIHHDRFSCILQETTGENSFEAYFEAVYYSFLLKKRKPDAAIYQHVLDEQRLKAQETLFIDDNLDNLRGAASLGIHTLHVKDGNTLHDYFNL